MGGQADPVPKAPQAPSNLAVSNLSSYTNAQANPYLQNIMSQYSSGGMSLQQALQALNGSQGGGSSRAVGPNTNTTTSALNKQYTDLENQMNALLPQLESSGQLMGGGPLADQYTNLLQQQGQLKQQIEASGGSTSGNLLNGQVTSAGNMALPGSLNTEGMLDEFLTNPLTGSQAASEFVRNDPLTSGLFGQGGIQDQAQARYGTLNNDFDADRQSLMGSDQSYGLQPQDLQAYNQAASNITRQFGQANNNLSQAMANAGLSSGSSGAAPAAFSGLLGSQNEQLANAQLQIALNRINTAQSLAQARTNADLGAIGSNNSLIQGLGSLGQEAIQNQYGRQLSGAQNDYNTLAGTAGMQLNDLGLLQNINNSTYGLQTNASGPGIGGILGGIGTAAAGGLAGGLGAAAGASLLSSGAPSADVSGLNNQINSIPSISNPGITSPTSTGPSLGNYSLQQGNGAYGLNFQ